MMMKQAPKPHFRDEDAVSSALIGLVRDSSTRLRLLKPFPAIRVVLKGSEGNRHWYPSSKRHVVVLDAPATAQPGEDGRARATWKGE